MSKITVEEMKKLITYCEQRGLACLNINMNNYSVVYSHPPIKEFQGAKIVSENGKLIHTITPKPIETEL